MALRSPVIRKNILSQKAAYLPLSYQASRMSFFFSSMYRYAARLVHLLTLQAGQARPTQATLGAVSFEPFLSSDGPVLLLRP